MVQRRVQRLRDDDLAAQLWFIRASFATMPAGAGRSREVTHYPIAQNTVLDRERAQRKPDRAKPQELLAAARAVGDRLETLAVRGEDEHCAGALQADVEWAPHDSHGSLQ
jgi:lantibiotic modifying enzyme